MNLKEANSITDKLSEGIRNVSCMSDKIGILSIALYQLMKLYNKHAGPHIYNINKKLNINYFAYKEDGNKFYLFLREALEDKLYLDKDSGITKNGNTLILNSDVVHNICKTDYEKYYDFDSHSIEEIAQKMWTDMYELGLLSNLINILNQQDDILNYFEKEHYITGQTVENVYPYNNILHTLFIDEWEDTFYEIIEETSLIKVGYEVDMDASTDYVNRLNKGKKAVSMKIRNHVDEDYRGYTYDIALYDKKIGSILDNFIINNPDSYKEFIMKSDLSSINIIVNGIISEMDYVKLTKGYVLNKISIENAHIYMLNEYEERFDLAYEGPRPLIIDPKKTNIDCLI